MDANWFHILWPNWRAGHTHTQTTNKHCFSVSVVTCDVILTKTRGSCHQILCPWSCWRCGSDLNRVNPIWEEVGVICVCGWISFLGDSATIVIVSFSSCITVLSQEIVRLAYTLVCRELDETIDTTFIWKWRTASLAPDSRKSVQPAKK